MKEGVGIVSLPTIESKIEFGVEENYLRMINANLPESIRVIAWCPVAVDFSARYNYSHTSHTLISHTLQICFFFFRFDCQYRKYKYFFLKGNLDIDLMRAGAKRYLGDHVSKNFKFTCYAIFEMTCFFIFRIFEIYVKWM